MEECLFLMLEGINGGKLFIEQTLNDVTGVNCVYGGGEQFFYVLYDPSLTDQDAVIEALIRAGLEIRQFHHIPV
ncbi:hypothetical protein [Desulfotomaculum copahuensis]|nr:hypothetical protein [Desulfotomaculum copahuensis]